jgi:hypothetical protein
MSTMTKMYSSIEAGALLNLTDGRIRQICRWSRKKEAKGPQIGHKIGRDWFLTDSDLELIRIKFRDYTKGDA